MFSASQTSAECRWKQIGLVPGVVDKDRGVLSWSEWVVGTGMDVRVRKDAVDGPSSSCLLPICHAFSGRPLPIPGKFSETLR